MPDGPISHSCVVSEKVDGDVRTKVEGEDRDDELGFDLNFIYGLEPIALLAQTTQCISGSARPLEKEKADSQALTYKIGINMRIRKRPHPPETRRTEFLLI